MTRKSAKLQGASSDEVTTIDFAPITAQLLGEYSRGTARQQGTQ